METLHNYSGCCFAGLDYDDDGVRCRCCKRLIQSYHRPAADCCWRCGADLHGDHSRGARLIDLEWRSLCATCDDAKETNDASD